MNVPTILPTPEAVTYPEDDGLPMSENTAQHEYIRLITDNLEALFANAPNVFIAGDLLWYPVKGDNKTCQAGDVIAVFGRPKGYRGSYRQWEEDGIAPQVVFEIRSPGNRRGELKNKLAFYQKYAVEEYYLYDPASGSLDGWQREQDQLVPITFMHDRMSPRLGVRFRLVGKELVLYRPDGRRFLTHTELEKQWSDERAEKERERAEKERERAEKERAQRDAEHQQQRAEQERQRAEQEKRRADEETERNARLLAKLKALGIDPEV